MDDFDWPALVDAAETPDDVLRVCRQYFGALSARDVQNLPASCQPTQLDTPGDLSGYALELVRQHCSENESALIFRMAAFFAHANVRVAQILRRTNDPDAIVWKFR